MSSNEDDRDQQRQEIKKRRVQRACDVCRKRKTRCDGGHMPNNKCTNCTVSNSDCTYTEAAPKRGPTQGYVDSLEKRVERLDKLLKRVCPDTAVYNQLSASLDNSDVEEEPTNLPLPPPPLQNSQVFLETVTAVLRNRLAPKQKLLYNVVDEDDETSLVLSDSIKKLNLDGGQDYRFFGKSSEPMLIQRAMRIKTEYTGGLQSIPMQTHRPEFWRARPWEKSVPEPPPDTRYVYPDQDLAVQLIDHYFEQVNLYLPLIHRPSFEKNIAEGLHLTNASFAHVYLLVCAIGSRWSDDRRVLPDGEDSWLASGWTWFHQVEVAKNGFLSAPTLYDIQYYCLCVQYLQGCSVPQATWTVVGFGIRLAQDVGAHRRKMKQYTFTAEDEMLKRAFWVLVCLDRMISAALGRPCAIQDEDFDLDLPINCDDEYWDHPDPEKRFKQPPNKPSKLTAFILYLKLNQILAFSLRFIYSINKAKLLLGYIGQHGEQHIVAELDSALNQWVDSLPDHLRWDPNRENEQFFRQSVVLYSTYYHIQILIHRPFIPSPSRSSPFAFPSLAICTNAARSASHIIDVLRKRNFYPPPHVHMAAFTAAIALLLNIWGGKRSGIYTNPEKEMADVYKCMDVLKQAEKRWHSAGRLWDVILELASVGDLPMHEHSPPANNKRERGSETPISSNDAESPAASASPSTTTTESGNRTIAGSKRLGKAAAFAPASPSVSTPAPTLAAGGNSSSAFAAASTSAPASAPSTLTAMSPMAMHILTSIHETVASRASSSQSASNGTMKHSSAAQASGGGKSQSASETKHQQVPQQYALPVYSDELGSLPVHGRLSFTSNPAQTHVHHSHTRSHGSHANGSSIGGSGMRGRERSYPTQDHMLQMWAQQEAAASSVGGAPSPQQPAHSSAHGAKGMDALSSTSLLSEMSTMTQQPIHADSGSSATNGGGNAGGDGGASMGTMPDPQAPITDAAGIAGSLMFDTMSATTGYRHAAGSGFFPWGIGSGIDPSSSSSPGLSGVGGLGGSSGFGPVQMDTRADGIHGQPQSSPSAAKHQAQAQAQVQPHVYTPVHNHVSSQPSGVFDPAMESVDPSSPSVGASGSGVPPQMTLEDMLNFGYVDNEMMAMWSNAPFELEQWGFLTNPGPS